MGLVVLISLYLGVGCGVSYSGSKCGSAANCDPGVAGRVPSLVGLWAEEACRTLSAVGYEGHIYQTNSRDDVGPGLVVGQKPVAGTKLEKGAPVRVVVSAPHPGGRCN